MRAVGSFNNEKENSQPAASRALSLCVCIMKRYEYESCSGKIFRDSFFTEYPAKETHLNFGKYLYREVAISIVLC